MSTRDLPVIPADSQSMSLLTSWVAATEGDAEGRMWASRAYKGLCAEIDGYLLQFQCNDTHEYLTITPPLPDVPEYSNAKCTVFKWVLPKGEESWRDYVLDKLCSASSWSQRRGFDREKDDSLLRECRDYAQQYRAWNPAAPDGATITFLKDIREFVPVYPEDGVNIGDYYVDQAPHNSQFFDKDFMAMHTPHGIRGIDSWFGRQIRSLDMRDGVIGTESGVPVDELRDMVIANPHLHAVIKTDLLHNLGNYEKAAHA